MIYPDVMRPLHLSTYALHLPGTDIGLDLALDADGAWRGIHQLSMGGTPLLAPGLGWLPEVRTPNGVEFVRWRMLGEQRDGDAVTLRLGGIARQSRLTEYHLHAHRPVLNLHLDPTAEEADDGTTLELTLRPVQRSLDGANLRGLSYQWRFRSDRHRIYQISERCAWAPQGTVVGSTIRQRNGFTTSMPYIAQVQDAWSTEWYLKNATNPNIFQFMPLQTCFNGFTCLSSSAGTLFTWATRAAHIRSLFEKPAGTDAVIHWHQHGDDLTGDLTTAPMEILWLPGSRPAPLEDDLHERMRELVYATLHADAGLRQERITTRGIIEEWSVPDLERYARLGMPKLLATGVKTVFAPSWFAHNQNQWNLANMCGPVDTRVPERDRERVKAITALARAAGAKIEMWGCTHVSKLAQLLWSDHGSPLGPVQGITLPPDDAASLSHAVRTAADPWLRNAQGQIDGDHYHNLAVLNLRDPTIHRHLCEAWANAHRDLGIDGMFNDSSCNIGSDKFHVVQNTKADQAGATSDQAHLLGLLRGAAQPAAILSAFHAHLAWWKSLQQAGMTVAGEDHGVFGVHRSGAGDDRFAHPQLWSDDVGFFDAHHLAKLGHDPQRVFFAGMACRGPWELAWDIASDALSWRNSGSSTTSGIRDDLDRPSAEQLALIRAYNEVEPLLHHRTTALNDDRACGWWYRSGSTRVLWAQDAARHRFDHPLRCTDVMSGAVTTTDRLDAAAGRVYRIDTVG